MDRIPRELIVFNARYQYIPFTYLSSANIQPLHAQSQIYLRTQTFLS